MFFRGIDGGVVSDSGLDLVFDPTDRRVFPFKATGFGRIAKLRACLHQDTSHGHGNGRQIHALKAISVLGTRGIVGWQCWPQWVDESFWSDRHAQLRPCDGNQPALLIPMLASPTKIGL